MSRGSQEKVASGNAVVSKTDIKKWDFPKTNMQALCIMSAGHGGSMWAVNTVVWQQLPREQSREGWTTRLPTKVTDENAALGCGGGGVYMWRDERLRG